MLYEGYGFTVANLYCLGFVAGGLASPITGPLVDRLGRKKSAMLYCILEILINRLEQYPILAGLIFSHVVGGAMDVPLSPLGQEEAKANQCRTLLMTRPESIVGLEW